jgi:L-iditol 2-dehydrogenase
VDRKPQQQTLSIRISDAFREFLERSRQVLSSGGRGELVSTSDVAKMLLESAKEDRLDFRLEVAERLGAVPIDYRKEDVVLRTRELTGGLGARRVLECAGTAQGLRQACAAVAKGGCVSLVGIPGEDIALPVRRLVLDEIELVGCRANPNTLEQALAMVREKRVDVSGLITHVLPLSEFSRALDIFVHRRDRSLKVVLKPNG